jgi:hypothetical protein
LGEYSYRLSADFSAHGLRHITLLGRGKHQRARCTQKPDFVGQALHATGPKNDSRG